MRGPRTCEKMLNITSLGSTNPNHTKIPPHTHKMGTVKKTTASVDSALLVKTKSDTATVENSLAVSYS